MSLCLRHKGTFYIYISDEKLTVTVGAGLAPARNTARVTNHVTTHVDVYRAGARPAPTVAVRKSET